MLADINRNRLSLLAATALLLTLLLSACGPAAATMTPLPQPTATPPPATATPQPTQSPTAAPLNAEATVRRFLDAVFGMGEKTAVDEELARSLLSAALRDQLGGKSPVALLGVQNIPRGYTVAPSATPEISIPENAYITAVLDYAAGPVTINFNLALVGEGWQISAVQPQNPGGDTAIDAEATMHRFLDALFGLGDFSRPDEQTARTLLAQSILVSLGDQSVLTLLGVQNAPKSYSVAQSSTPEISIPENAYYTATLDYDSGPVTVDFMLALVGERWEISSITPAQPGGGSPDGVVWTFLNLVFGPDAGSASNESAAKALLDPALLATLGDQPAVSLIGVQNAPLRYSVGSSPEPEITVPEQSYWDARLDFTGGTEVRRFTLALTNDGWRIQSIQRVPDLATATPEK